MKLLHFTDFHLHHSPASAGQFHVQPFWPNDAGELFARMGRVATGVDAIAFTGDAVHGGQSGDVARFFDLLAKLAADKPVFMVLGNHDVVDANWPEHFQRGAEQYRNVRLKDGVYPLGEIDIALINNQYVRPDGLVSQSWNEAYFPVPAITNTQAVELGKRLAGTPDRPALVLVHCPTHALPPTMMHLGDHIQIGMERYRHAVHSVLDSNPRAGLVLSGHVHFTSTRSFSHGRVHQTLGSVAEFPHQVRLVEMDQKGWTCRLVNLADDGAIEERGTFQCP